MDVPNYRKERIQRLIDELEFELTRGIMDREIDRNIYARFCIPMGNEVVSCEIRTSVSPYWVFNDKTLSKLKIVK